MRYDWFATAPHPTGRPMTDGEALRRVIVAEPDDDTPRLIYADWLDENSQPDRAALIRHQIEAERAEPYSARARTARGRADELLAKHGGEWAKGVRAKRVRFVRGFVGHVVAGIWQFPEVAPPLFAAEPVQSVTLTPFGMDGGAAGLAAVLDVPELARVRDLELARGMDPTPEELAALAACPRVAGLVNLSLRGNPVPPAWLSQLLEGKALPNLTGLNLSEIPNLGPGLATAAERASHRRFKRLDASGVAFQSSPLQRLLTSPCLSRLEELILCPPVGSPAALAHLDLGWVLPWDTLRKLDLGGQGLGAEAVREFVRLPDCAHLKWLGLAANRLGSAGARVLVESPHLNLNHLDVSDNGLDPSDLAALQSRFPNAKIESA